MRGCVSSCEGGWCGVSSCVRVVGAWWCVLVCEGGWCVVICPRLCEGVGWDTACHGFSFRVRRLQVVEEVCDAMASSPEVVNCGLTKGEAAHQLAVTPREIERADRT